MTGNSGEAKLDCLARWYNLSWLMPQTVGFAVLFARRSTLDTVRAVQFS